MATLKVRVGLSEQYRKAQFVATGEMPAAEMTAEFDAAEMTAEQRATVIEYGGTALTLSLIAAPGNLSLMHFDGIPMLAEVVAGMAHINAERIAQRRGKLAQRIEKSVQALSQRIEQHDPQPISYYDELSVTQADEADALGLNTGQWRELWAVWTANRDAWTANRAAEKARQEQIKQEECARQEQEAAVRRAAWTAAKAAWVQEFGSDYLKRACGGGYDCARLYVHERAAMEAPGFVVDFDDRAGWKARSCPSLTALDIADGVQAKNIGQVEIVWLTQPTLEDYDFEECEAVVVWKYLGRYDLIKMM